MLASPVQVADCRVEITVTSRAAGWPRHQFGRKISAGRLLEPGIRDGTSFQGGQGSRLNYKEEGILNGIMPIDEVPFPAATDLMVTHRVCHLLTFTK